MRIATWNVNGLRARLEFIELWLKDRQPDVVGLQELKTPDADFPYDFFKDLGYEALVHGQKSWNGVAILHKPELSAELVQAGLTGEEDWGSRLICADIDNRLRFTTVYCPNGKAVDHDDYPNKLRWFETLATHLQNQDTTLPQVICGDFNIVPTAADTHKGEKGDGDVFHTKQERERLQGIMDCGFTDFYRHLEPDGTDHSWWDYRGGAFHRKLGLRIDFILGTDPALQALESHSIDRDYRKKKDGLTASDHAPVIAELSL